MLCCRSWGVVVESGCRRGGGRCRRYICCSGLIWYICICIWSRGRVRIRIDTMSIVCFSRGLRYFNKTCCESCEIDSDNSGDAQRA